MVGFLRFTGCRGRSLLLEHRILGMTLWEARIPGKIEGYFARKRTLRVLDALEGHGCRRLLSPCPIQPDFPAVSTRSLWQSMAAPLAIAALRRQGKEPHRCTVGIEADRASRPVVRACTALSRQVSALSLSPTAEHLLGWRLERSLGIPLVSREADVTLSFLSGCWEPNRFALGAANPTIPGFTLTIPELSLPEGCPELQLLSALLEEGRLPLSRVMVVPDFP